MGRRERRITSYNVCYTKLLRDDLYKMFHVWSGPVPGGLAIGTIGLMVVISAMNGLSVAGMAIGATIALRNNFV